MLDCCRHPLPGSHLIVLVLSVFFIRVFNPINVIFFSENILHKHVQLHNLCSLATSNQIFSSSANSNAAEQICTTPELRHWHRRIFIHQLSNFTQVKCTFTQLDLMSFLYQYFHFFMRHKRKRKRLFFIETRCRVSKQEILWRRCLQEWKWPAVRAGRLREVNVCMLADCLAAVFQLHLCLKDMDLPS